MRYINRKMICWALLIVSRGVHAEDDLELLKSRIASGLEMGAEKAEVEMFLKSAGWVYGYDKKTSSYLVLVPNSETDCEGRSFLLWLLYECQVKLIFKVDAEGRYSGVTVEQVYSGL